jgi:hypothetical protein
MKKLLSLLILTLLLASCAPRISTKEVMNSWLKHHKSELIRSWGPPHRTATDGKDGEIYIYESSSTSAQTFKNVFGVELPNPITTVNTTIYYRQFFINKDGRIYYVRWGSR